MSTHSKVIAQTDRQTDRHTHTHTHVKNITSTAYAGGKNCSTFSDANYILGHNIQYITD